MIRCGSPAKNRSSRELTARGLQAVATYRIAPKEELQSAERARGWFEKANVEGVVAMRPVSSEKRISYNDSLWLSPSYNTFWGYYGYGYSSVVVIGGVDRDTVITVETMIFSGPATSCCGRPSAKPGTRRRCRVRRRSRERGGQGTPEARIRRK